MRACVFSQRSTLNVFQSCSLPMLLRQGLSLNLEELSIQLPWLAWAPGVLLSPSVLGHLLCVTVPSFDTDDPPSKTSTLQTEPAPQPLVWHTCKKLFGLLYITCKCYKAVKGMCDKHDPFHCCSPASCGEAKLSAPRSLTRKDTDTASVLVTYNWLLEATSCSCTLASSPTFRTLNSGCSVYSF